ncbi:MAG: hypothetical protein BWY76_00329 [bacterium ADurb.Bin429]|nr:MAG: hypothetical protein BWY76_00329 [bacterium ADurb.Bin429]
MHITACRPYHSVTVRTELVPMPDGISAFKVYYISLVGRDEPARYEWEHCSLTPAAFARRLCAAGLDGVGFVTAFPHITKVFRFAPAMETVLHVRAFSTVDLTPLNLARGEEYLEFACYAEAAIAADEYHAWAAAHTVEEYLTYFSPFTDGPVVNHAKLAAYAAQ